MTSPDTPSSHVAVIERSEVVGELAWIDTRQAADYTSVSVATIRKACSHHDLQHIRIGRANGPIRTWTEWVDAWMLQGVQEPVLD
jgi:hypothetical protein